MPKRLIGLAVLAMVAGFVVAPIQAEQSARSLTYWGWAYTIDCLKANMDEFAKAHPEIKVTFKTISPGDIYLRLPQALSTGIGLPDVVAIEDSHLPQMISTGGLLDLSALAGPYRTSFNSFKWAAGTSGGKVYAMPWDSGPVAIYYRRDVFERAGLPSDHGSVAGLLDTWSDYARIAKTIKEKTGVYMLPLSATSNDGRLFEILLQQQGLGYFDRSGQVTIDSPPAQKTLEFLGKMYKDGLTFESVPWTEPWQAGIRDGAVATVIGAAWMDGFIRNWIAPKTAGAWGVVPLPTWSKGVGVRTSNDGGTSLVIPKRGKQTDAAWSFVKFMLTRKESQVNMMRKYESFPALETAYADPLFGEALPFYADQPIRKVFTDLARQIHAWQYTEFYPLANSICSAEIQSYLAGSKDAKSALSSAARNIRTKIGR